MIKIHHQQDYITKWRRMLRMGSTLGVQFYPNRTNLTDYNLRLLELLEPYDLIYTGSTILKLYGLLPMRSTHDIDCYASKDTLELLAKKFSPASTAYEISYAFYQTSRVEIDIKLNKNTSIESQIDVFTHEYDGDVIYSRMLKHTSYTHILEQKLRMLEMDNHMFVNSKHFTDLYSIFEYDVWK